MPVDYSGIGIISPINGTCQRVDYDASAVTENPFTVARAFEVTVTTDCHMRHGSGVSPTAGVRDLFLLAKVPRQFPAKVNERVAFIKAKGGEPGTAYVTELEG